MIAPLQDEQPVSGYVEYNSWNYFNYVTNTEANLVIRVSQSDAGDCDLYVRANANPTRFEFDYQDIGVTTDFNLTINDPGHTTWHIGVYGWSSCSFSITVDESNACPLGCSGNGQCLANGACLCNAGWSGEACDSSSTTLQNGAILTGQSVAYNQWAYYSISVSNTSALHIQIKETSTTGLLWLYVSDSYPTLREYYFADTSTVLPYHRIDMEFQNDVSHTYTVHYRMSNLFLVM